MNQSLNFTKGNGLIPAIIQDSSDGTIYMLGYMNEEAFVKTQQTGIVHFWSRSRNKLWMKGEESGNTLQVQTILADCDADTLLIKVMLQGTHVCHTGSKSCFFTKSEVKI